MNTRTACVASALVIAFATSVFAQPSPAPSPQVFASASGTYGFKTQPSRPPDSRGMSQGMLFRPGPSGAETVVWKGFLLNVPHRAIVADDGKHVVTLDVWGRQGYERCLVIYDAGGIVVASFDLEGLLSKEEISTFVVQTPGSRNWLMGGRVEFNDRSDRVVVTLSWGRVISILLATGEIVPA